MRIIPWKITKYSCISIYRNKYWWNNNLIFIKDFWNEVLLYKNNGYKDLLPPKKAKKKFSPPSYDFLETSDSE